MITPYIDILGIHIAEPFTWLTNWLVAAVVLRFGHSLYYDRLADTTQKFWAIFFLFIGIASLAGGAAHGFINYVGQNFHYAAWVLTGMAIFAAELATIQLVENEKLKSILRVLIYAQLLIMVSSVMYLQSFNSVRINSAIGLLAIVMPISLMHYMQKKDKRSFWIMAGIISNLGPAIIHGYKISYNQWFNFNDISHIIMIFCFYIIFKGAKQNVNIDLTKKLSKAPA